MSPTLLGDFLELDYRADLDVLVARWLRPIELEEVARGYHALLAEAERRRCRRWLIDVRRRRNTHQIGAAWMVSAFLPELGPRLGGRTRLAYFLMPTFLRDHEADAAFPPPAYFDGKPTTLRLMRNEDAALNEE